MKVRILAATTAAAAALALIGGVAPVAQAATQSFTLANCAAALDGQTFNVSSGNDLAVSFTSCSATDTLTIGNVVDPTTTSVTISGAYFTRSNQGGTWRIDGWDGATGPLPDGTYTVYYVFDSGVPYLGGSFTVAVGGSSPSPSPSSGSSTPGPSPIIQQFGHTVGTTCDEAAPSELDWAGVSSGGWGRSWAQWMNVGLGGEVCSRTLAYDAASARWVHEGS